MASTTTPSNPFADDGDRVAPPAVFVVFGASGDLTSRKLIPAIEALAMRRLLPGGFSVVGVARTPMRDDELLERTRELAENAGGGGDSARHVWEALAGGFRYISGAYGDPDTYLRLATVLAELDGTEGRRRTGSTIWRHRRPPSPLSSPG